MKNRLALLGADIRRGKKRMLAFFSDNRAPIARGNWHLLKRLSLVYLATLLLYAGGAALQTQEPAAPRALLAAIAFQALYSAAVWRLPRTPAPRTVGLLLLLFGTAILALATWLGVFASLDHPGWMLPMCLILMTQFYTVRPLWVLLQDGTAAAVFLALAARYKAAEVFWLDVQSTGIALVVAVVSLWTIIHYKVEANDRQKELDRLGKVDSLTRLLTRRAFLQAYEQLTAPGGAGTATVAVAMLDIDRFKRVNDRYGHGMGDEVLEAVAALLRRHFEGCAAGRFGGDEFVVAYAGSSTPEGATRRCTAFVEAVQKLQFPGGLTVSCSMGAALSPAGEPDLKSLLAEADAAMYAVKRQGGNGFQLQRRAPGTQHETNAAADAKAASAR